MDELNKLQAEAESRMQYKPVEAMTMADAMREKLNGIEQVEPKSFGESNAYKKYFSTKQDILEEAKTINKATGIPINAIIDGNVEKAREIYDYQRKQLDPEEVYKTYPGLKRLAELDENEAAIALHDLKSVKKTHDVFEAAKIGYQTQSLDYEKRTIGLKAFEGTFTDEDRKRVAEIDAELNSLKEIPVLMEAPGQNIVGSLTQQVPMMARQLLKGQVMGLAGAVAGGAIGAVGGGVLTGGSASPALGLQGMRIGYSVGSRIGFATEMFKESVGGYYLDYIGYKDKKGNQLLTDGEARVYATVTALAETGIEMANFGKVLEILKGNKATVPAAKVIENIVKNSKDAASIQAQLKTWLSTNMKNIGIVVATESAEEGVQQMSEMGITQIARVNNPEGDIPVYNATDIVKGGLEASYQALGASIGLGGLATGASGLRFTRHAAQLLSLGKERADEALRTQTGVNLLNNLMEAAQDTELGANHKETFNKLMKSNLEGTVHETAYVDSELLLAEEGGDVVFNQLAAAAGYTEEQINTLRETGAPIEINTADVVSTIAGASEINIADYVSFDAADRCFARNQKVAKELNGLLQKVKTEEVERTINNINTLTTEMFGETEERDLATMIIAEFEDPIAGIEERRMEINREISDMIDPVVEEMRGGMGQGVALYATDDYGNIIETGDGAHIGGAVRLSNNAPWYSKYYKANKKRPSEQELRELAEEVITGNNEYGVGDYDYTDPGMVEYAEETKARLENLRHELELLNNIEPKLKDVNKGDFAALDALSEDGVKVYKAIMDKLRGMPNKAVKSAASMGALIYAHRAETHAKAMRLLGNKKYTAQDYMASHPVEFGGEVSGPSVKGQVYNQLTMKAPNGMQSNLTEAQWNLVRSKDFIDWFGDWEAAAIALKAKDIIDNTQSVVSLTGEEFGKDSTSLVDRVVAYYKQIGKEIVTNPELGDVKLDRAGVKDSLGHGMGRLKAAAYAAVPSVIEKGIVYAKEKNWKNRGYDTAVLIANIEIGEEKYVCEVVVKQGVTRQGFYLHEVALKKDLEDVFKTVNDSTPSRSKLILAQYLQKGKEALGRLDENGEPLVTEVQKYIEQKGITLNQMPVINAAFKKWFGNSKVTDPNGNPIVLYHQTNAVFDTFDVGREGAGKSDTELPAGIYLKPTDADIGIRGNIQMPLYARIENPITFDSREEASKYLEANCPGYTEEKNKLDALNKERHALFTEAKNEDRAALMDFFNRRKAATTSEEQDKIRNESDQYVKNSKAKQVVEKWSADADALRAKIHNMVTEHFKQSGYDGIILEVDAGAFGRQTKTYIAFENTQVKSATDNVGTFSNDTPNIFYQSAWHGSPHLFERFDLGAIGTGEGAQAHGWGLYFAKNKEVAKSYRERLSDTLVEYDGEDINILFEELIRKGEYGKAAVVEEAMTSSVEELRENKDQYIEDEIFSEKDYEWFEKQIAHKVKASGSLFEVDVPEDNVLLDEDLSFEEQPEKVKEAIHNILGEGKMLSEQEFLEGLDLQGIREAIGFFTEAHLDFETSYLYDELKEDLWTLASELYNSGNVQEAKNAITEKLKEQLDLWVEENGIDADVNFTIDTILEMIGNEIIRELIEYQNKDYSQMNGSQLYDKIADMAGGHKQASLLLNENGVKGIAYDGAQDGRCFVVFDDKAIAVINRFNQAAGRKALTANWTALEEAMQLKENGEEAKTIYEKTGWYLGADGKWRFDIPDNLDKINIDRLPGDNEARWLRDIYDNPALYEAYPWLATVYVRGRRMESKHRGYANEEGITINSDNLMPTGTKVFKLKLGRNTYKIEREFKAWGWETVIKDAKGNEVTGAMGMAIKALYDIQYEGSRSGVEILELMKKGAEFDLEKAEGDEKTRLQEKVKRFEEAIALVDKYADKNIVMKTEELSETAVADYKETLIHEIQHLIQRWEKFATGGSVSAVRNQIQEQIDAYTKRAFEINNNAQAYYNRYSDWENAILNGEDAATIQGAHRELKTLEQYVPEEDREKIIELFKKATKLKNQLANEEPDYVKYLNLHGEQEARAAERKAKIATEIARGESLVHRTDEELIAEYGKKIKDQEKFTRWQELRKKYNEGETTDEDYDEMVALKEELEKTKAGKEFFKALEESDDAEWAGWANEERQKDYDYEVLNGIGKFSAIVLFGGEVMSSYSTSPKGQTVLKSTGERVIKLFESADESTFIHEIAHVAYEDLRELASYANAPAQFKRDIKTLDDWANWKDGQLKEYEGTSTYKEFAQRDAAIREALANNDIVTAEQLKYEWRQERFARGFEEYLKKGKAPTEGLRKVFYQFKTWLTKIYRAYRGIGGVPTKEVEAVMTRLLLTEEAIELAEKKAEIDAFEKSGVFNYLGDNAKAMWQKILEDVRKDATSKVLKIAMKDMSELAKKERQEKIDAEREAAYERLSKEPVWAVYSYLKYNPKMDTLAACKLFGLTVEEYVGLLKANGGSLERAVENYMVNYIAELEAPKKADIEARAEEAMTTSYYKTLLSAFETEMLQREVRREARLSKKLAGIVAKDETERAEIEKSLRELDKKGDEAKAQRALRDVAVGNVEKIRQYAKEKLAVMDISYSANPVVWKNASRQKAAEMTEALAKKDYNKAVFASKMRLVYDAMADIATENKKLVDRKSKQMRDRAKTIRREKNMGANDRYVYNHLLYAFGLAERDVPRPPQFTTFNEVLISYDSTLSMPFIGDNGELLISDFIINAGTGTGKAVTGIHELTVSEFTELANVMDNIYTVAVEANKIKTVTTTEGETITVDQALAEITDDAFNRHKEKEVVDTTMAGNVKKMDDVLDTANRIHISLLKAETILGELSDKAVKYIYDPIKRAAEKELKMTVAFGEKIEAIRQAWLDGKIEKYLNQGLGEDEARKAAEKEIEEAFTVERYKLGTSNITKENIIAFALNWGTEINRKRAMNYPGTTTRDYERIFAEMDGADWQFVTNVWDLFEETWPQLKKVEANVSGVTLEKQEGITFNVTGKDGANYIIQGKYYPIKYDPKKNQKVQRQQKEEGVRTNLPSMARMGVGIGMTKERAVSTSYLMRNDLGVFAEAIQENIHLICMREAVRDASRLINDERFADTIKRTLGGNALSALQDWVLDCWQLEPKVKNDFESAMAYLRRKQTTAVLAFRLSTALLNVANIGPVMHYLGMGRTKKALMDFYAHPIEQYNFVIERSPFVKNRAQTMDRDMRDVVKGKGIGDKMNKLEAMGFYMITKTDLMLACPLWLAEYQRVYRENAEQLSAEQIERMAVDAGDKAVRSVFGSGMVQDLAAVQRGGEVTKMLTMYYSYFSVVQQAISKSAFEYNRRKVNGDDWYKRWAPVANTIILWLIIPSAISAIIKMGIEAATGDDDDEITFENFIKRTGADTINAAAGGVPILRDVVNVAMAYAVEGKYYGARSTSIGETTEKMMDVIRSIKGFADDKKDLDDVLRAVFRATAYTTGIPVAGADALSTLYQWIAYGDATPEEIREYLTAILFDKKVKK